MTARLLPHVRARAAAADLNAWRSGSLQVKRQSPIPSFIRSAFEFAVESKDPCFFSCALRLALQPFDEPPKV